MNNAHITMRHLAEAAGVTPATVSMALRNHPRISKSTRGRIQELACSLGYAPNPYVSALMRLRRQGCPHGTPPPIAIVNLFETKDGWANHPSPTIRQMQRGLIARAAEHGFQTEEFWLGAPGMKPERLSDILHARGISGAVFGPMPDPCAVPSMKWDRFCAVALSVPQPGITITTVCSDHYFSMLQTMRECYNAGFRRPGLVLDKHPITRFHCRWEAGYWIAGQILDGMTPVTPFRFEGGAFSSEDIEDWIAKYEPDVIITTASERMELELAELGLAVPDEMGLVSMGLPRMGHPITGIFQNGYAIGASALDAVVSMIERHETGLPTHATSIMIQGEWNAGATLRHDGRAALAKRDTMQPASPVAERSIPARELVAGAR